jgi:hypothetical protein
LHRQNLLSLINSIDDGATSETVRGKIVDLLSTLNVQEISVDEAHLILKDQLIHCFDEVGDQAHERAAWIQQTANGVEVAQKGYLKSFPPQVSVETPSKSGDGKDREDLLMGMEVEVADAESSAVVVDIERGTGATGDIK